MGSTKGATPTRPRQAASCQPWAPEGGLAGPGCLAARGSRHSAAFPKSNFRSPNTVAHVVGFVAAADALDVALRSGVKPGGVSSEGDTEAGAVSDTIGTHRFSAGKVDRV